MPEETSPQENRDELESRSPETDALSADASASKPSAPDPASSEGPNDAAGDELGAPTPEDEAMFSQDEINSLLRDAEELAQQSEEELKHQPDVSAESSTPPAPIKPPSTATGGQSVAKEAKAEKSESHASSAAKKEEATDFAMLDLPDFSQVDSSEDAMQAIDLLKDVGLHVKIELGRSRMLVEDVLRLGEGSVVELDKLAGDPVDVYVNDRLVARGEILVLNDNFCVRVNEIVTDIAKGYQTA